MHRGPPLFTKSTHVQLGCQLVSTRVAAGFNSGFNCFFSNLVSAGFSSDCSLFQLGFQVVLTRVSGGFNSCFSWFQLGFQVVLNQVSAGFNSGFSSCKNGIHLVAPRVSAGFKSGFSWCQIGFQLVSNRVSAGLNMHRPTDGGDGCPDSRGSHSSTSQLNLSRFGHCNHKIYHQTTQKLLTTSRQVDECKPLPNSGGGGGGMVSGGGVVNGGGGGRGGGTPTIPGG